MSGWEFTPTDMSDVPSLAHAVPMPPPTLTEFLLALRRPRILRRKLATMSDLTWAGESVCRSCKRIVKHKPHGGPHRWHGCRLRWIARRVARAEARGWDDGYRFALDNVSDPMVYADLNAYGDGWAGVIERGGLIVDDAPARAWDEGFAIRADYEERRDVPTNWPDLNPYRGPDA